MSSLAVVAALDADVDPSAVEAALAGDDVNVVAFVHGLEDESDPLLDTPADVLVLACGEPTDAALSFLRSACSKRPERPVVVLSGAAENGHVGRIFEAGADDLIRVPEGEWWRAPEVAEQLTFVVEKAMARRTGPPVLGSAGLGRMVCVLGPKGGIGKTLTSSNLTVALAATGASVTVVDIDLQFGDVALCLGLPPERTVYDLAQSPGALDYDKLDAFLATHSSGVRTLIAPRRPDQASAVGAELLREVYSLLRANYDWVVVDTPPGFTAEVITSIDSSTDVVMVGMLDSLSLKNTKLGLETLELMKYDPDHIYLLLNRAHSRVGISQSDVEAVLGRTPDVFIPSDREIPRTVNEGIPIVVARPQSEPAEAFGRLADLLAGPSASDESLAVAAGGGSRRRLFGRKA